MKALKRLFSCIKCAIIGFAGGDARGKYGIVGLGMLLLYFLLLGVIVIVCRAVAMPAETAVLLILIGTAVYIVLLFLCSVLYDLSRRLFFKRRK